MITTRHETLTRLVTEEVQNAIAEINAQIATIELNDLKFDCDDRIIVHLKAPLTMEDQELLKHQLEHAGWKSVSVLSKAVKFYF